MSIYRRGEIWWVNVYVPGGRAIRQSSNSTKKRDAQALERKLKTEIDTNKTRGILGLKPIYTFEQAVIKFIESGNAPKSMVSHIKQTTLVLRHVPLNEDIIAATADMKENLLLNDKSPCTVNRRLAVVQRILNIAYTQWRWIDQKLGDFIGPMKMNESEFARHVYLTQDQVIYYLKLIKNPEIQRAVLILCISGLRVSELCKLDTVNWTGKAIRLDPKQKSKQPRSIPIAEEYHFLFENLPLKITYKGIRYWWEKVRQNNDIRIHDLRHTFGSWLAADPTVPLVVIREVMGHKSIKTTNRYIHIRNENTTFNTAVPSKLLPDRS